MPNTFNSTKDALIPIRTLSLLTGVNSVTLRAWERRYGLLKPQRTHKGHRLYTQQHVDIVQQILSYLDQGIAVSQVKPLLQGIIKTEKLQAKTIWHENQEKMLAAIHQFNTPQLDNIYHQALSLYPVDLVTKNLVLPLLTQIKNQQSNKNFSHNEQQFFNFYIHNKLAARLQYEHRQASGPHLLVAGLSNDKAQEIDLLLFSLAALEHHFQVTCLGNNIDLKDLSSIIERNNFNAIVLIDNQVDLDLSQSLINLSKIITLPFFLYTSAPAEISKKNTSPAKLITLVSDLKSALKQISVNLNT